MIKNFIGMMSINTGDIFQLDNFEQLLDTPKSKLQKKSSKTNFHTSFLNAVTAKLFSNIGREPINTTLQQN